MGAGERPICPPVSDLPFPGHSVLQKTASPCSCSLCFSGECCPDSLPSVPASAPCCSLCCGQPDLFRTQVRQHLSREVSLPHRVSHPSRLWSSGPVLQVRTVWFICLYICFRPCPLGSKCRESYVHTCLRLTRKLGKGEKNC